MAFLGIKIPIAAARLLSEVEVPGKRTGMHEMHITILMFEDNWPISEITSALETAYDVISKIEPFTVKTKKISCFPPKEGKPHPIIALVESKKLHELSKKLRKKFNKDKIDFDKTFKDYNPHITLSYADKEIKDIKIDPVEITVHELVLFGGDHSDQRIFITFPLKGPGQKKHGMLLQKCEMFEKWATSAQEELDKAMFEEKYQNDFLDAISGTPYEKHAFIFTYKDLLRGEKNIDFWRIIEFAEKDFRAEQVKRFPKWVEELRTIDPYFADRVKSTYIRQIIERLQNFDLLTNGHRSAIWDLNDWQDFFTPEQLRDILKILLEKEQKDGTEAGEVGLVDDLEMLVLHNDKVDKKLVARLLRQIDPNRFATIQPTGIITFDKEKYTTDDVIQVVDSGRKIRYEDLAKVAALATPTAKQLLRRIIWWADAHLSSYFIFDESMKPLGFDGYGEQAGIEIPPDTYVGRVKKIPSTKDDPSIWEKLMKDYQIIPYPKTFVYPDPVAKAASMMAKKYLVSN